MVWAIEGQMLWPGSTAQREKRQSSQREGCSPPSCKEILCSPQSRKRLGDQPELSMRSGDLLYLKFSSSQVRSSALVWGTQPLKAVSSSTSEASSPPKIASAREEATFSLCDLLSDQSETLFWKPPASKHRTQNAHFSPLPHKHVHAFSFFYCCLVPSSSEPTDKIILMQCGLHCPGIIIFSVISLMWKTSLQTGTLGK